MGYFGGRVSSTCRFTQAPSTCVCTVRKATEMLQNVPFLKLRKWPNKDKFISNKTYLYSANTLINYSNMSIDITEVFLTKQLCPKHTHKAGVCSY